MSKRDPMIGRVLHGTIEIRRLIGAGGMGNVYEGYQAHLERRVAVKVMTPEHARNPIAADYFFREAKFSSKLRHPNIIQIIDYGKEDDDTVFMAMEFVPGQPLSSILREEWPLSSQRVSNIISQALSALEEAHSKKIVHRDLKPDNLMVEKTLKGEDFVKVLDFGIAQSKAEGAKQGQLTQAGSLVGTPNYMSPEQAKGESVDHRSDLFSMGVILYEILTGKKPFKGKHVPQILVSVITHDPPPPSAAVANEHEVDPDLETVCLRAMRKNPALRYQSATEFKEALANLRKKPEPKAVTPPAQFIFKRSKHKRSSSDDKPAVVQNSEVHEEDDLSTMAGIQPQELGGRSEPMEELKGDTQALHGSLGDGESEVVDISLLFGAEEAPSTQPDVGNTTDYVWTLEQDAPPTQKTEKTSFGVDLEGLRGDLVGEKQFATALVMHQRSHTRLDAETLAEVTAALDGVLDKVVEKWGGRLQSRQGSFTTIMFGLPSARADDVFRATQAALELRVSLRRKAPDTWGFGFALAAGEVFCPGGEVSRAAGPCMDDASDASRAAGDNALVAMGSTLQKQLETTFRLGPLASSGERPVLGMFDVARHSVEVSAGDLIGRDAETASILAVVGKAVRGSGGHIVITSEAGMGKSSLINNAVGLAEQRDMLTLRARARFRGVEGVRDTLMQWILELGQHYGRTKDIGVMFRELGLSNEYGRVLEGFVRNRLSDVLASSGSARSMDASTSALRAIEVSFRALIRAINEDRAVVLVLDQLQEFDSSIASFFGRWSKFAEGASLVFLTGLTVSPGQAFPDFPTGTTPIHLDPLDEASALAYIKVNVPNTVDRQLCNALVRASGGIPQHLEQLSHYARQQKSFSVEDAANWLSQARDVVSVLRLRFSSLDRNAQNTIGLLASLGDGTLGEVVLDLASADWRPEKVIQDIYTMGIINIGGSEDQPILYFNPPAFEGVIYDQLSRRMRLKIHEKAVEYFQQRIEATRKTEDTRGDRIRLVRHLIAAGQESVAILELDRLAEEAAVGFEYEVAEGFVKEALELVSSSDSLDSDDASTLKLQLVRLMEAQGRTKEAVALARELDRKNDLDPKLHAEARLELAAIWVQTEDPDLVGRSLQRTHQNLAQMNQSSPGDVELQTMLIRSLQLLGTVFERQGQLPKAADRVLEAIEMTERLSIDMKRNPWGPRIVWEPLNQLGRIRLRRTDLTGAGKMFELALNAAQGAEDVRGEITARANLGSLFAQQNRMDAATRSVRTALGLARKSGDLQAAAKLEHNLGQIYLRQKRPDQAIDVFRKSLKLASDLDWREGIAMNANQIRILEAKGL